MFRSLFLTYVAELSATQRNVKLEIAPAYAVNCETNLFWLHIYFNCYDECELDQYVECYQSSKKIQQPNCLIKACVPTNTFGKTV